MPSMQSPSCRSSKLFSPIARPWKESSVSLFIDDLELSVLVSHFWCLTSSPHLFCCVCLCCLSPNTFNKADRNAENYVLAEITAAAFESNIPVLIQEICQLLCTISQFEGGCDCCAFYVPSRSLPGVYWSFSLGAQTARMPCVRHWMVPGSDDNPLPAETKLAWSVNCLR